jgi:hypothetical protein
MRRGTGFLVHPHRNVCEHPGTASLSFARFSPRSRVAGAGARLATMWPRCLALEEETGYKANGSQRECSALIVARSDAMQILEATQQDSYWGSKTAQKRFPFLGLRHNHEYSVLGTGSLPSSKREPLKDMPRWKEGTFVGKRSSLRCKSTCRSPVAKLGPMRGCMRLN